MFKRILVGAFLVLTHAAMAEPVKFTIKKIAQEPGNVTDRLLFIFKPSFEKAQIPVKACVDVSAKNMECQNYTAGEGKVSVQSFGTDSPHAGFKIYDKSYKWVGCESQKNGFCILNLSSKTSKTIELARVK